MYKKNNNQMLLSVLLLFVMGAAGFAADPNGVDPNAIAPDAPDYDLIDHINPENVRIVLNFQDALVTDVLDYLSEIAGLVIVADTFPTGRINLVSKQPMNIDEVVALISTVLKEKGYAAVRTGRTLKLVSIGSARYQNIPVTTGNDPDKIIEGDDIVTHIIPIRYANAIKLQDDISPLISEYAVISSNEASNSLIITDTTANIKRLVKIVTALDTQMATVADVKVFLLEYADAENTADLINEVFEQQTSSSSDQNQNPFMRMMGRGGGPFGRDRGRDEQETGTSGAAANIPVIAAADERTNAVVVSGPADVLVVIDQVVKELDSNPDEERTIFVYKLKYAQADNLKDKLNSLFQELQNINEQNTRTSGGGNFSGRMGGQTTSGSSGDVSDEVYIEADEDTNSLLVMTSSKNYDKIEKIIETLDIPIPQVLIKVLLAELTTTDGMDVGVEWSLLNVRSDGDQFLNEFSYTPVPLEGFTSQIISGDLTATLRALQEVGDLNVLSRPYILTSNNQTATINVGQRYPFVTDSRVSDTDTVINTVEYDDIGIILEVTPSINSDGLVIMDINPSITVPAAETVQVSESLDATVFNTRSAQCRVVVPHGKTIVIGGLMQDTETESVEKIPLLGDLPILGGLFKRTLIDKEKTELLIFLTPQVASRVEDLDGLTNHEVGQSQFINNPDSTKANSKAINEHMQNMKSVYQENVTGAEDTESK